MVTERHPESEPTRRVTVIRSGVGWEVREERGGEVVRTSKYTDWHRVERAVRVHEQDDPYSTNR